jgi:hypothetical protein
MSLSAGGFSANQLALALGFYKVQFHRGVTVKVLFRLGSLHDEASLCRILL